MALLQDLQDRLDVQRRRRCRIKTHLHVTGNAWPGVAKEQHQCLALPVVAANIDPQHRLCGIFDGLLLLFGLLSRCVSGSSHVDQREAGHHHGQDGHGSTKSHPIFRPNVCDDVSDDLDGSNSHQSKRGLDAFPGRVLHAGRERGGPKLEAVEAITFLYQCPDRGGLCGSRWARPIGGLVLRRAPTAWQPYRDLRGCQCTNVAKSPQHQGDRVIPGAISTTAATRKGPANANTREMITRTR
jgi:hypothetical protein